MNIRKLFFFLTFSSLAFLSCVRQEILPEDDGFTGYIAGDVYDGYGCILRSGDNGLSWYRLGSITEVPGVDMNDISALDQSDVWAVGNIQDGYGMILHSSKGGINWERQCTKDLIKNAAMRVVNAKNLNRIWVCGEKGKLLYSEDKGSNWSMVALDSLEKADLCGMTVVQNNIWVIGNIPASDGGDSLAIILRNSNGGQNFTVIHLSHITHLNAVFAIDDSLVFIASGPTIYKSVNGGLTFLPVFVSVTGSIHDLCATSGSNIWAAGDQGRAYRSTDDGQSWQPFWPQSASFRLNRISLMGTERIWICGSSNNPGRKGVFYYSNNAGNTWFIGNLNVDSGIRGLSFVKGVR